VREPLQGGGAVLCFFISLRILLPTRLIVSAGDMASSDCCCPKHSTADFTRQGVTAVNPFVADVHPLLEALLS
jgi:hypothetical protein